ncbi:MAG: stage III sporulation protein AF [Clostridia bacterium]|nr:stage III sporulation protein AF [Clostridia bacterium]
MSEYWMTLIGVCLLGSLLQIISPEGDLKKYVRLVSAFCLILALARPLAQFLGEKGGLSLGDRLEEMWELESVDYEEIYYQNLLSGGEKYAEEKIKSLLLQEFDLNEDDVSVEGRFETKNDIISIEELTLYLHETTLSVDPREMIAYVNETWSCPCTVIYDEYAEK